MSLPTSNIPSKHECYTCVVRKIVENLTKFPTDDGTVLTFAMSSLQSNILMYMCIYMYFSQCTRICVHV